MHHYTTHSETETQNIAKELAAQLTGGNVVLLTGNLGAGKTTFVKGLTETLGIAEEITSPTFTLMNMYPLPAPHNNITTLVHIDTYRLKDEQELIDIGVLDYLGEPHTLTIIEWPEKIQNLLKQKSVINISIEHALGNDRTVTIS